MLGHRSKSTVRFQESFSWTIQRFLFLFWLWTRNAREKMEYVILFLHLHSISTSFWKNTAFLLCWSADHDMVLLIASFSFFFFFGAYHKRIYSAHCDCSIHHKVFLLVIMIDIFQKKIFNQCWSIMTDWQYSFEFSSGAPLVSFFYAYFIHSSSTKLLSREDQIAGWHTLTWGDTTSIISGG